MISAPAPMFGWGQIEIRNTFALPPKNDCILKQSVVRGWGWLLTLFHFFQNQLNVIDNCKITLL